MATDPLYGLTPQQIAAAEALIAAGILDYRPDLEYTPPPGTAAPQTPIPAQTSTSMVGAPLAVKTTVNLIATYRDIQALTNWQQTALSILANNLSGVIAPVDNAALSESEKLVVSAYLNSNTVTFGNLQTALADPTGVNLLIIQAWSRTMWNPGGRFDGLAYINLYRTATTYLPLITTQAQNLLALMAYTYVGTPNGESTETYIAALTVNINNLPTNDSVSGSYSQVQSAITAATSETFDQSNLIATATQNQANSQAVVAGFTSNLASSMVTNNSSNNSLSTIISTLQGLLFLLNMASLTSWASFSGIESRIFNLILSLVMGLVGQAANAFAQIVAQILAPVQAVFMSFAGSFGGSIPADINVFGDTAVQVMEYVVSRFEKFALDWYRSNWLHLNLSGQSTNASIRNAGLQNLINILNELIQVLQLLQGLENNQLAVNWEAVGSQVANGYGQQLLGQTVLTKPAPLVNPTPPQNANIDSISSPSVGGSAWGLQMSGSPSDILGQLT